MKRCPGCSSLYTAERWHCPSCDYEPTIVAGFPALAPDLVPEDIGFHHEAFASLASLEARNFWFRSRNQLIVWGLRRHFPNMQRFLEIGCGTGYVLAGVAEAYPHLELTGTEAFIAGLTYAANRVARAELLQMDARRIPYQEEFDVVGAFDVLEHIHDDECVLTEAWRALRPNGGIILTVPQHRWLWSQQDEYACHVRRYETDELRKKVLRAGFRLEWESSFVSFLLPAMAVSRIAQRDAARHADAMAELHLPRALDAAFGAVMRLEQIFIRLGLRLPIGGSRMLIARKIEKA